MSDKSIIDIVQEQGGFITTGEVKGRGEYEQLRRATEDGTLTRIRQGVYVETSALANNMIDVQRIVPNGVLCLYSTFANYGLSTQVPAAHASLLMPSERYVCLNILSSSCITGKRKT